MFDIGWTEILILAVVSLFVIGPKDIPKFLGYIGRIIGKIRGISSDLRETVDDAIKNSELEEVRKEISFTDPELSKNFNDILNPVHKENKSNNSNPENNETVTNEPKKNINEQKDEINKNQDNSEFAGPTEKLPTGLKHIREDTAKEEKKTSKIEKT
ncbi:MAG: twin-arginine translocase subunit TatB [Alphaproteobacteria bacterium TMED93]|nr:MAG: twin-arginine translocase subunit TatB [Alphaproteobacteria bacterium TMED93]